jgi:hypothetical protein
MSSCRSRLLCPFSSYSAFVKGDSHPAQRTDEAEDFFITQFPW